MRCVVLWRGGCFLLLRGVESQNHLSCFKLMRCVKACRKMLALKEKCNSPQTKKPYMLDSSGGRDNSAEGHQVVTALLHFTHLTLTTQE